MAVIDRLSTRRIQRAKFILGGMFAGFVWGLALRAWMTLIVVASGELAAYSWKLTFLIVLFPSTLIGGVFGWAESVRRLGGTRYWRYSAAAPSLFIVGPILIDPTFFNTVFANGLGFGAVIVTAFGLIGGYAFSGRGPRAARIGAKTITVGGLGAFVWGASASLDVPSRLEALPLMISVMFICLMAIWIAASARPYRRTGGRPYARAED